MSFFFFFFFFLKNCLIGILPVFCLKLFVPSSQRFRAINKDIKIFFFKKKEVLLFRIHPAEK